MAKAYSKAAKLKAKKAGVKALYSKFEAAENRVPAKIEEDPQKAAMRARAVRVGQEPGKDMLRPMLGSEAGRALYVSVQDQDERQELFQTFLSYDKALTIYARRVLGRQRFPAVSKMEFMPERLETGAMDGESADLRTEQEKVDAARQEMAHWDAILGQLHSWQANIIRSVSYQQEELLRDAELTGAGRSFISAIRELNSLHVR